MENVVEKVAAKKRVGQSCTMGCCPAENPIRPNMETVRRGNPKLGRNDPCPLSLQ
jgi:hypothetical protein